MKTPAQTAATGTEFSHQAALFQWANVAAKFGLTAAGNDFTYTQPGLAAKLLLSYNDAVPELAWLFAIKNAGHGDAIRGARSAAEGVKAGVPDLCLPVPRPKPNAFDGPSNCKYHGLYIELKRPKSEHKRKGVASIAQDDWQAHLSSVGYRVAVSYGWEHARDCLLQYLGRSNG